MARGKFTVVIAGAGVAGLEAMLALRALAGDRLDIVLLAPGPDFSYRPLSVAEPFGLGKAHRFDLETIVHTVNAELQPGALASVDADRRVLRTSHGLELGYDALLVAAGGQPREALPGALTFRGQDDVAAMRALLRDAIAGHIEHVVFAASAGVTWSLPLYELALLTAAYLAGGSVEDVELTLATHEERPLGVFGAAASTAVEKLLTSRDIALRTSCHPVSFRLGALELAPGKSILADRVVALPRLTVQRFGGLPQSPDGFLATDPLGRVDEIEAVYAAGDVTAFPVKQGGIAAQQAEAAAHSIAAAAGANVEPKPFRPVLRGLLLTGGIPRYLRVEIAGGHGETSTETTEALWWPPSKIVGRYLAPFLAEHAGLADQVKPPPGVEALPVVVDLTR
jgi:sulfide:quinone oxidoreductase